MDELRIFIGLVENEAAADHAIEVLEILRDSIMFDSLPPFGFMWSLRNGTYRVSLCCDTDVMVEDRNLLRNLAMEALEPLLIDACSFCRHNEACEGNPQTCGYWMVD